jgi:tetratricopeptide (TPR) repeat protein
VSVPAAISRRWRAAFFAGTALLLAAGAAATWWWSRGAVPAVPPMPQDIPDAEVRQAVERAHQQVQDTPGDAEAWGRLGMILMAHQLYAEADPYFAEAARLDPQTPSWPCGRAVIALKRQPDEAPALLRQALSAAGGFWPEYQSAVRLQLAEVHLERMELAQAEELFQEARRRQPDNPRAALGLGMIARARDDARTAETLLRQARSSPLAHKRATVQLAAVVRTRGDSAAAVQYDQETAALPDDPPWPDPFQDAIRQLRVGHYAWLQQESQFEDQHRFVEAANLYLQEARTNPTARAYARAGFNLAQAGDYDRAVKYLSEAVQLDPSSAHAHYLFAFTLFVRAESAWKRAPSSPQAQEWFRASIAHARRTTELRPTQAIPYLFWGRALKYLGEPGAAVAPLRQGIECAPENFPLQLALGEVLLEIGQNGEAETHLKNAQKLNPKDPRPSQALERLRRAAP